MAQTTAPAGDATDDERYIAVYQVTDSSGWSSRYVDQIRASDRVTARRTAEETKPGAASDTCRLVDIIRKPE